MMKTKLLSLLEIFLVSLKLGLTSFGGPVAHLAYFHQEYVVRRKWITARDYADLVALCQFLPGPASSQVGISIGVVRAGLVGGVISFIGFTFPSALALTLFALFVKDQNILSFGWLLGLKIVSVVVVLHAVLGMGSKLANTKTTATVAALAMMATLVGQGSLTQVIIILIAALIGILFIPSSPTVGEVPHMVITLSKRVGAISLILFFMFLFLLPIARGWHPETWLIMLDGFYRSGALVFGGGHVVLPLLERELIPTGLISKETFLVGYGATQAVPGPLFTFSAYLGMVIEGGGGAIIALIAIFLPAFLLVVGTLPFWHTLRNIPFFERALNGVNAAVVGILFAALYDPIFTSTIQKPLHLVFAITLYLLLMIWKVPVWLVVITGAVGGSLLF